MPANSLAGVVTKERSGKMKSLFDKMVDQIDQSIMDTILTEMPEVEKSDRLAKLMSARSIQKSAARIMNELYPEVVCQRNPATRQEISCTDCPEKFKEVCRTKRLKRLAIEGNIISTLD